MRYFLLIAVLALAGCAGHQYTKAGATTEQLNTDEMACNYQVQMAMASHPNANNFDDAFSNAGTRFSLMDMCLKQKGWN